MSLHILPITRWDEHADEAVQSEAIGKLEQGNILYLPHLPFHLTPEEQTCLRPDCVIPKSKSIKYSPTLRMLWGIEKGDAAAKILPVMMKRYANSTLGLIKNLFPSYANYIKLGTTSFRPVEAKGRAQSKRHDDQLLHVDAFPSRPMRGKRILRVFSNINPGDQPRIWQSGEPFSIVAKRFLPKAVEPGPNEFLKLLFSFQTKKLRSLYDHYMLQLHDLMKMDDDYQATAPRETLQFSPGSSWIVYTDQVSHAALSGQHAMEQTFALPLKGMKNPATSPLKILESVKQHALV